MATHQQNLPSNLSTDEYILILVSILADINTLSSSIGPLTSECFSIRDHARKLVDQKFENRSPDRLESSSNLSTATGMNTEFPERDFNPYVPFTADHEYRRVMKSLQRSLDIWESSFRARTIVPDTQSILTDRTIWPLWHFSKLLVEAGPSLYVIPSLVGYSKNEHGMLPVSFEPRMIEPHRLGIRFNESTVQSAVEILEAVEADRKSQKPQQIRLCPIWYPFALFYGALVVWSRMREDEKAQNHPKRLFLASTKLLQTFQTHLEDHKSTWACAERMASVVESLTY